MKKLVVAALMVLSTSAAFAGPSESLKAILKAENYAEAQQLVNSNLAQLTDNAEKAAAYNKLVDLAFGQVDKIRNVMMENSAAQQMGKEAKPVDEEGLYTSLSEAFDAAQECYKYDNLPNAKGKIKAKFSDANAQRLYALRGYLINGGGFYQGKDNAKAFKLLSQYCESADYPMFAKVKNAEDPDLTNAAFFASYMALQNKDYANAEKYSELSLKDPEHGKDALSIKLEAMKHKIRTVEVSKEIIDYALSLGVTINTNKNGKIEIRYSFDGTNDRWKGRIIVDNKLCESRFVGIEQSSEKGIARL